jgi:replicative DNA helicase
MTLKNFEFQDSAPLPKNLDLEEAILGTILNQPNAIDRVKLILNPEDFSLNAHQKIYSAFLELHRLGKAPDLMLAAMQLSDNGQLESIGGHGRLATLYDSRHTPASVVRYAEVVKAKAIARTVIGFGHEIVQNGYDDALNTEALLSQVSEIYRKIQSTRVITGDGLVRVGDSLCDSFSKIEELSRTGAVPGTQSGFLDLDSLTSGFQDGELAIIAGRPSMGKTAYATHMALNMATENKVVAFFSMEMSMESLVHRLLSILAEIETSRMKLGHIYTHEWEKLAKACAILSETHLYIDSQGGLSPEMIVAGMDTLEARIGRKVDAVFIDYLQLMQAKNNFRGNKNLEIGSITSDLKQLAITRKIPVFLLSQLSRAVEARADKRPMMSDLRESGNIEQDADLILMLYRDEYYDKATVDRGIAEVIVNKNRNGPVGTAKLLFEPQFTRFKNIVS